MTKSLSKYKSRHYGKFSANFPFPPFRDDPQNIYAEKYCFINQPNRTKNVQILKNSYKTLALA